MKSEIMNGIIKTHANKVKFTLNSCSTSETLKSNTCLQSQGGNTLSQHLKIKLKAKDFKSQTSTVKLKACKN